MVKINALVNTEDFQNYILDLWKNDDEINRIMNSTRDGDKDLFRQGFKFGLIWASLCITRPEIHHYSYLEV